MALTNYQTDILADEIYNQVLNLKEVPEIKKKVEKDVLQSEDYCKIKKIVDNYAELKAKSDSLNAEMRKLQVASQAYVQNLYNSPNENTLKTYVDEKVKKATDNIIPTRSKIKSILVQNIIAKRPVDVESVLKQLEL